MEAKCTMCRRVVPATYEEVRGAVLLVRHCDVCGDTDSLVSTNPRYFGGVVALAQESDGSTPQGLIVELLDQCDIQCPTCIAGSSPFLRNLPDPAIIQAHLESIKAHQPLRGIFLSGGEPAVHPHLFEFMSVVDRLDVDRKVLITNGLRLARDQAFSDTLLRRLRSGWEVFLQFDVLDSEVLQDIRGGDFVVERERSVSLLGAADIATTLVAVAKRNVSLHRLHETVAYGLERPWIRGVQIQPIREAGRLENYSSQENTCLASDVHEHLQAAFPGIEFSPHLSSPLSVSLAYAERRDPVRWIPAAVAGQPSAMYIEPTIAPIERFRVSVMEYSDEHNWSSLRLRHSPLAVLQSDGSVKRVDDHWDPVGVDLGPLRSR